ncbi:MAG: NmrA/HSCARG family protein [Calditrichia bacterium]
MKNREIIAVVGATGAQGGALARALLGDPEGRFGVRALTRNPKSENAMQLAEMGAEVMQADLDDAESLANAFEGAYGAFCLTNFWEHFSPEKELQQAKNLAEAAKAVGVKHLIWSTLEDTREYFPAGDERVPTLMGKYKVPHLDAKGEANRFFKENGVPTTFLHTSFYWDNLINLGMGPQKGEDGLYYLALPMADKNLAGISVKDIGKCAAGIFKAGKPYINKSVGIAGEHLTGAEMADKLSRALNQTIHYQAIPHEVFRGLGFPGADDLGNMFQFFCEFEESFLQMRDISFSRELNPQLQTFKDWLSENAARIPLA